MIPLVALGATALMAAPSGASGATTIGQTGPPAPCSDGFDWLQPTTSGNAYVVPATVATGTITSWRHNASPGDGRMLAMKVFRKVADPATYMAVAHDGPRTLNGGVLNTFTGISVPVKAGDLLGLHAALGTAGCLTNALGETTYFRFGNLADGQQGAFDALPNHRLNIAAVVEPDCDQDGLGDETQDTNTASCPTPAATAALTCRGAQATIVGTEGNDVRTGTPGRDVMLGLGGNDTLSGLAGNDVICGAKGNDKLNGGKGKDTLLGQKGNDKLNGGKGKDTLSGKKGKDTLKGGGGNDKLKGGGGRDLCIGGKANDSASKCEVEKSI
jgi:Ca2+-binding RTX toxin-like protein